MKEVLISISHGAQAFLHRAKEGSEENAINTVKYFIKCAGYYNPAHFRTEHLPQSKRKLHVLK